MFGRAKERRRKVKAGTPSLVFLGPGRGGEAGRDGTAMRKNGNRRTSKFHGAEEEGDL